MTKRDVKIYFPPQFLLNLSNFYSGLNDEISNLILSDVAYYDEETDWLDDGHGFYFVGSLSCNKKYYSYIASIEKVTKKKFIFFEKVYFNVHVNDVYEITVDEYLDNINNMKQFNN